VCSYTVVGAPSLSALVIAKNEESLNKIENIFRVYMMLSHKLFVRILLPTLCCFYFMLSMPLTLTNGMMPL